MVHKPKKKCISGRRRTVGGTHTVSRNIRLDFGTDDVQSGLRRRYTLPSDLSPLAAAFALMPGLIATTLDGGIVSIS